MIGLGLFNYWVVIFLMMVGFYTLIARGNLVKKIIGLNVFQTSVFILYITMGKIAGGTAPILLEGQEGVDLVEATARNLHRRLVREVQSEQTVLDDLYRVETGKGERHLEVEAGLGLHVLYLAEAQHDSLLAFVDDEHRRIDGDQDDNDRKADQG